MRAAAKLINKAERPLILAGQGVTISGAEKALCDLAEKASIPVASTLLGLSAMPSGHTLYKGMLGMHGNIGPNYNTNRADIIIGIGMRFDDRVTGVASKYAPDAKIVHIDIDSSEFDKVVASTVAVHGDAARVLEGLIPLIEPASDRHEWLASFEACRDVEVREVYSRELHREGDEPMTMGEVVAAVSAATGHDAIAVTDVGQNQMMSARYFQFKNNFLGNVRQWQNLFYHRRFSQTPLLNPDFRTLASAYGIPAEDVKTRTELPGAIDRMLSDSGAYILNVDIDPADMVFPMTPAGKPVDTIMLSPDKLFDSSML